jgi:hypothetical protein
VTDHPFLFQLMKSFRVSRLFNPLNDLHIGHG